ncbi:MAG: hypothetical protein O2894_11420 [Planctomycetota bacterium]|nr:hypothetical protein [Planctomycetota bacterium]
MKSPEGELFRKVAEQGHYAGRTRPTGTRQGLYASTADGRILGALNHNDPARVAAMLEKAWAAWLALPSQDRAPGAAGDVLENRQRMEQRFPDGGLVLRVYARDLPREDQGAGATDWRARAWNLDYAWFRAAEAKACVPTDARVGAEQVWPLELADRVLRVHLVDNVRGQTYPVKAEEVERAQLRSTVTAIEAGVLVLRITGEVRWVAQGAWRVGGMEAKPTAQERGLDARVLGTARFDPTTGRFTAFDLVAVGTRWGATQYNGRTDDEAPAPIGFVLELAGDSPAERVAPAGFWNYRGY